MPKPVQKDAPKKRDLSADRRLFKAGIEAFVAARRKQRKDFLSAVAANVTAATEKTNA